MARIFLDTNVIIYAFTDDPRSAAAEAILAQGGCLSVQVLNEFANVARRKLGFDWAQIDEALGAIRTLARAIHPIDLETHEGGVALARRHGLAFYDALIVSAALHARCDLLYSEDMHDGLVIDDRLRIINPFHASQSGAQ